MFKILVKHLLLFNSLVNGSPLLTSLISGIGSECELSAGKRNIYYRQCSELGEMQNLIFLSLTAQFLPSSALSISYFLPSKEQEILHRERNWKEIKKPILCSFVYEESLNRDDINLMIKYQERNLTI